MWTEYHMPNCKHWNYMKVKCYFFRFWDTLWLIEINVVESWQRNKHRKPFLLSFEHSCLVQLNCNLVFVFLERVKKFFSKHLKIWTFDGSSRGRHWAVAHYRCNQEAGVSTVRSQQIQDYNTRTKTKYKYNTNEITQCQLHQEEKITLKPRPKCENCTKRSFFFPTKGSFFPDQGK